MRYVWPEAHWPGEENIAGIESRLLSFSTTEIWRGANLWQTHIASHGVVQCQSILIYIHSRVSRLHPLVQDTRYLSVSEVHNICESSALASATSVEFRDLVPLGML